MESHGGVVLWVSSNDCDPPHGLDMSSKHDFDKVAELTTAFLSNGFDKSKSVLIGYPREGRIQLLSGTHRHEAAKRSGVLLPVALWLRSDIENAWGRVK